MHLHGLFFRPNLNIALQCVEEHKKYDAGVFRRFLIHALEHYLEGEIVMILDNAKIHHTNLLKDLLDVNPKLRLEFLPPYSPNLNKISIPSPLPLSIGCAFKLIFHRPYKDTILLQISGADAGSFC